MEKIFKGNGEDFSATHEAEAWCRENGYSIGTMQNYAPRGILKGAYDIAKWRNLSSKEIAALDGEARGNPREGPITVEIYDREPAMLTRYFTFGQTHVHSVNGRTFDKDDVAKITAPDPRKVMFEYFGPKWAFEYTPEEMTAARLDHFPKGIT